MPMRLQSSYLWMATTVDAVVLASCVPQPGELARDLAAPRAWVASVGADEAAATLGGAALWCAAAWFAVGLVAALLGHLPGTPGRLAGVAARAVLPKLIYRIVAGTAGVGVLLTPLSAEARTALPSPTWPVSVPSLPAPSVPAAPSVQSVPRPDAPIQVRTGDSLWRIVATRLGTKATDADVAAAWPRAYAANRAVIGADPDLLMPGQSLHLPEFDIEENR
jgi:nucleoid-associated protein YgaU